MFKILKKADIVLFVLLLALGTGLFALSLLGGSNSQPKEVRITIAGEEYGVYDLSQNQEFLVEQSGHTNKVIIKDGEVQITEASCYNKLCINQGRISKTGQRIICLPNRVVVEILEEKEGGEPDVISG